MFIARLGSLRPVGEALTPLVEGLDPYGGEISGSKYAESDLRQWVREQLNRNPSLVVGESGCGNNTRFDLRLLLGVMGAPLVPVHVSTTDPLPHLSIKNTPIIRPLFYRGNCCTWRRHMVKKEASFELWSKNPWVCLS